MKRNQTSIHNKFHNWRPHRGYSLVTVLLIGAVAVLFLAGTSLSLMQVYQNINAGRYGLVALAAAEYGAEQEIGVLNNLAANQGAPPTPPFDGVGIGNSKVVSFTVPNSGSNNNGGTAQVTIQNIGPSSGSSGPPQSLFYDRQRDGTYVPPSNANAVSANAQLASFYNNQEVNDWRMVTSVGTYMGTSRTVQVILQPQYEFQNLALSKGFPQAPFLYGTYGLSEVSLLSNVFTDGSTLVGATETANANNQGGDVGGGRVVGVGYDVENPLPGPTGKYVEVGGSVTILVPPITNSPGPVLADGPASQPTNQGYDNTSKGIGFRDVVDNLLTVSANNSQGFYIDQLVPGPPGQLGPWEFNANNDNVRGNSLPSFGGILMSKPIILSAQTPPTTAPAPSAPSDAIYSGNMSFVQGSPISPIEPGDYIVNSLTVGRDATVPTDPSVSGAKPVNIYIQDAPGDEATAINLDKTGAIQNVSGNPAALNIFYNGSRPINITSYANLAATIYAPNAPINVSGNPAIPATTTFAGAITGNTVRVSNARMLFDQNNLKSPAAAGSGQVFNPNKGANPFQLQGLKAVSWREL